MHLFNISKYTKIYHQMINDAIQQNRKKLKKLHSSYIYYVQHHIIPKSISGDNSKANLVLLTACEHFIEMFTN